MKNSISTATALLLLVAGNILAQNETDALRYSQLSFGGTARYAAMGGSFGALGADFSTLSSNPAGLGVYRRSEISITPGFMYQGTTSTYAGTSTDDQKAQFNFNNIGLVFAHNLHRDGKENGSEWKFVQFGIGMNRLANYNSQTTTTGISNESIMGMFQSQAVGTIPGNLDNFGTALAFNTYLIDTIPGSGGTGYTKAVNPGDQVNQTKTVSTSGSYSEMVISLGGNYGDKLFLGGTLGIPYITYNENSSYIEAFVPGNTSTFSSMTYNQNLTTTGQGYNFKFGATYKPFDYLRVGLAFHSKTWLSMHDNWNADMTSTFSGADAWKNSSATSGPGNYDYSITTPGRIIASVAGIIGKEAVINLDYESVDYSQARLSSADAGVFTDANAAAKANFTRASIIRLGGELKLKPLALRLGAAYYQSPYSNTGNDDARTSITGGVGFRHKKLFLDMAYIMTMSNSKQYLYDPTFNTTGPAVNATTVSSFLVTFGIKL